MKKILLLTLVALFAFNYQANAQRIGVKLGYGMARQSGEVQKMPDVKVEDYKKALNSFCAGVFFDSNLVPILDLRVGLDFASKGLRLDGEKVIELKSKLNYLEIPVLAKVNIGPLYALGGFYGGYAVNGKISGKLPDKFGKLSELTKIDEDIDFDKRQIKRMDYGVRFGAGLQIGLGPIHAFAQAEYSYGLANISKIDGISTHNSFLAVTVGVMLGM